MNSVSSQVTVTYNSLLILSIIHHHDSIKQDEFVTSLAALALYDGDAEVTSENIATLLSASGNTVASYWPSLFAGTLRIPNYLKYFFQLKHAFTIQTILTLTKIRKNAESGGILKFEL